MKKEFNRMSINNLHFKFVYFIFDPNQLDKI